MMLVFRLMFWGKSGISLQQLDFCPVSVKVSASLNAVQIGRVLWFYAFICVRLSLDDYY